MRQKGAMTSYGYARTSTADQTAGLEAQERDLRAAGAALVFSEQCSANGKRARLEACLAVMTAGDVLIVTKPDRLARSTSHLLTIVDDLNRRGIGLVFLSMGGEKVDTRNPTSKLMLTLLAAVAEFERELMKERQREGIMKAKELGRFKGRQPVIDPLIVREAYGRLGGSGAAKELGIHRASVYRIVAERE